MSLWMYFPLYPPSPVINPDHKCCILTTNYMYILSNYTTNYYTTRPTIALQHDQYKFDMFERE